MSNLNIKWNGPNKSYGAAYDTNDDGLIVNFYNKSVHDPIASRNQGVPIYHDVIYVKIFRAGEMLNQIDRPKEKSDETRFGRQWHQFVDKQEQVPEGTPIDYLFPNNPAIADSLRARGVYTVQQCASLTAHAIETIGMGAQEYVNRAKKVLEQVTSGKAVVQLQDQSTKDRQLIDSQAKLILEMQQQMEAMKGQINTLMAGNVDPSTGALKNRAMAPNRAVDIQSAMIDGVRQDKKI